MRNRRMRPDRRARILWPSGVTTSKLPPTMTLVTVPFISTRSSRLKLVLLYRGGRILFRGPLCKRTSVKLVLLPNGLHDPLILELPGRGAFLQVLDATANFLIDVGVHGHVLA